MVKLVDLIQFAIKMLSIYLFVVCCFFKRFIAEKLCCWIIRVFLFGFGYQWIRRKGQPADHKVAPIMIVAPHSSLLDGFILFRYKIPSFISRQGVRNYWMLGCEGVAKIDMTKPQTKINKPVYSTGSLVCFEHTKLETYQTERDDELPFLEVVIDPSILKSSSIFSIKVFFNIKVIHYH